MDDENRRTKCICELPLLPDILAQSLSLNQFIIPNLFGMIVCESSSPAFDVMHRYTMNPLLTLAYCQGYTATLLECKHTQGMV